MRSLVATLLPLVLVTIISAHPATFVPKYHALQVRGGAGPLDPSDTAKLGTLLAGTQASLSILSPSRMAEIYGSPKPDAIGEEFSTITGAIILSFCIQAYYLMFRESDLKTAVGIGTIPRIVMAFKILWNEDYKKLNFKPTTTAFMLAVFLVVAHACLVDGSKADSAIKFYAIFNILYGSLTAFFPAKAVENMGTPASADNNMMMRMLGVVVLGLGVYQTALAWDMDPLQAFGVAWMPQLLFQMSACFITKEYEKNNVPTLPSYLWMLFDAIVVGTCGLDKGLEHHKGSSPL